MSEVTGLSPANALLVVSNLAALAGALAVWRLVQSWRDDPALASVAVWLLVLFPASSVLPLAYAEGLGLLFTSVALAAIQHRRGRWAVRGGVAAFAGGLVRPTGIFVSLTAAIEWARTRRRPARAPLRWWAAVTVGPVLGVVSFHLLLAALVDDGLAPLRIQRQLRAGFREPVSRFATAVWRTLTEDFRDAYNVAFAVLIIGLVVLAATRYRRDVPLAWTVTAAFGVWVALAANNIDSFGRYSLSVYPAWLAAMALLARERRWVLCLAVVASAFGYVWMTVTTMRGLVVP